MEFDYNKHIILLALAGSRSYGTNKPESDYDYRGIIIPPPSIARGFLHSFEQKEGLEGYGTDSVAYAITKSMKLAAACNPNVLETYFVPEEFLVVNTKYGRKLRKHAKDFLSQRALHTHKGYAFAQLKRIKRHKMWWDRELSGNIPPKPDRAKFGLPSKPLYSKSILNNLITAPTAALDPDKVDYVVAERQYFDEKQKYDNWKTWSENRNPARHKLELEYGYDCYSDDTLFLTKSGWKLFDEIGNDEKLATFYIGKNQTNRRFGGIEYQKPIDSFENIFTGEMHHFTGNHMDIMVTPNHRMFTRKLERASKKKGEWRLEEASRLPDTFEVLRSLTPKKKTYENQSILESDFPLELKTYLRLMGWYLSDGTLCSKRGVLSEVKISQKKGGRLCSSMIKFHNKYSVSAKTEFYEYNRQPNEFNPNEINILSVRNKKIVDRLLDDCGRKKDKKIPRWVFGLSKRLMETLFDAMVMGDGTHRKHKTIKDNIIYYSTLPTLANDVNELAVHCGWETALWGPYHNKEKNINMYQVFVDKSKSQTKTLIRSANIKKIPCKNKRVVCFTVPNGTLITRRNGKVAFHGNCKHGMHLVRLMKMCEEILKEGKVIVNRPDAKELLAIRDGAWPYDKLIEWANEMEAELDELALKTSLPKKPNLKKLNALCVELVEEAEKDGFGK